MMMMTSVAATALLILTVMITAKLIDESVIHTYLINTQDLAREKFISATPFLPRAEIFDETATYTGLCFLAVLCLALCWVVSFLFVKILTYVWAFISKPIELLISMIVYLFSSMSTAVVIQMFKVALIPMAALIIYLSRDLFYSMI
ncbi:uncharacterized protein LOC125665495 [Ostrea edulis]|uniref:uncharacterized protein LOC125665495 n=1 Tax=Ostrea edulis TaxID=37623 RepID=UPI0024AED431|nr:uncharacterized protein LOC125665495 [Ostrea edulis]